MDIIDLMQGKICELRVTAVNCERDANNLKMTDGNTFAWKPTKNKNSTNTDYGESNLEAESSDYDPRFRLGIIVDSEDKSHQEMVSFDTKAAVAVKDAVKKCENGNILTADLGIPINWQNNSCVKEALPPSALVSKTSFLLPCQRNFRSGQPGDIGYTSINMKEDDS